MKTITKTVKAKYFAQYYNEMYESDGYSYRLTGERLDNILCGEMGILHLNSLEQISDEDKKELDLIEDVSDPYQDGYLSYGKTWEDLHYNNGSFHRNLSVKSFQYLQSKGYALPYMEYSVDDLIKLNVIKLK